MSLEALTKTINEKRDAAGAAVTSLKSRAAAIRSDGTRTGMGKKSLIAGALRTTQQRIKQLQDEEVSAVAAERSALEREIFGTTVTDAAGIMAYRDAQARAAELGTTRADHDKARAMLHTASLSNDNTMASAVLSRAVDLGWTDLIDEYKEKNHTQGEKLDNLLKLDRWNRADEESFNGRYGAYFVPTPDELRGVHEAELNRLAKSDGGPSVETANGQVWGVS